jgi:hypothetical protein
MNAARVPISHGTVQRKGDMTDSERLQQSLAAMGFAELGLVLVALCCYSLVLSGPFGFTGRSICAAGAVVCAGAFAAMTDPWVYGVVLMATAIAGMGLFVVCVWGISALCGLSGQRAGAAPQADFAVDTESATGEAPGGVRIGPRSPIHSA